MAATGLVSLAFLPDVFGDPFIGLLVAVFIYAIGGGLLEVLVSPIVEALPTANKDKVMSMLHSFYCWGCVGVILLSTVFFRFFGINNWKILAIIWAVVPTVNMIIFTKVRIYPLLKQGEQGFSFIELVKKPVFWFIMIAMLCAGASEQAVSQWASTFAEKGLNVSKTVGDLTGPMFFAILMGTSRFIYGKIGEKLNLEKTMIISSVGCACAYLLTTLPDNAVVNLAGCGMCGFFVGIMWPGTFSIASSLLRRGGTLLFAFMALAGDLGCSGGPTLVGIVTEISYGDMKTGILAAIIFPVLLIFSILLILRRKKLGKI